MPDRPPRCIFPSALGALDPAARRSRDGAQAIHNRAQAAESTKPLPQRCRVYQSRTSVCMRCAICGSSSSSISGSASDCSPRRVTDISKDAPERYQQQIPSRTNSAPPTINCTAGWNTEFRAYCAWHALGHNTQRGPGSGIKPGRCIGTG